MTFGDTPFHRHLMALSAEYERVVIENMELRKERLVRSWRIWLKSGPLLAFPLPVSPKRPYFVNLQLMLMLVPESLWRLAESRCRGCKTTALCGDWGDKRSRDVRLRTLMVNQLKNGW